MAIPLAAHALTKRPWPATLACAAVGVAACLAAPHEAMIPAFCGDGAAALLDAGPAQALGDALRLNPPQGLALGWSAMLLAMMPPLLVMPIAHVRRSSMARRRGQAVLAFALAYAAVWVLAGAPLLAVAILLRSAAGNSAPVFALGIALAWSASPCRHMAHNRAHLARAIRPFGPAGTADCLAYGAGHAALCASTCWAWMLAPLAVGHSHLPAMLVAFTAMLAERRAPPGRPRWQVPRILAVAARRFRRPAHARA